MCNSRLVFLYQCRTFEAFFFQINPHLVEHPGSKGLIILEVIIPRDVKIDPLILHISTG